MKMNKKLLLLPVFITVIILFLVIFLSEMNFLFLKSQYEEINRLNKRLLDEIENRKQVNVKIKTTTFDKETMITTAYMISSTTNTSKEPVLRKNLFPDLYKYSVHNPNFRTFMEWPPTIKLSAENPNLAEILDKTILSNMSSWEKFNFQISKQHIYEENSEVVEDLLHDMNTLKIVSVEQLEFGMQFKLKVKFENGGMALFKPQRFPRGVDAPKNTLYLSDFERHVSEIAAYHLDKILGFRKVPPVVGRKVNITKEIYPLADDYFVLTFFYSPDGNYCFHGKCKQYCDTSHAFCGNPDLIEGSFTAWMISEPKYILGQKAIRSPYKRTYLSNRKAPWEDDDYYCVETVPTIPPFDQEKRVYDIVDAAIFDFLIGNMDRHHYNYHTAFGVDPDTTFIHMDNGRGFGQAYHDEMSILIPLSQCCQVRLSTFNVIYNLHVGPRRLSDLMRESLTKDPLAPILTEPHLEALDRRVDFVLDAIKSCVDTNTAFVVFLDDIP